MALSLVGLDSNAGSSNTLNGVFDEAVAAGSSLVVMSLNNDKRNTDSVTSSSLGFTERVDPSGAAIYDDMDTAASKSIGDTVTANYSSSAGRLVAILKFAGIATYVASSGTGGNSANPSTSLTADAGNDLGGCVASQDASAISTPSGWTELFNVTVGSWRIAGHKREAVSAGSHTYNPVCTGGKDFGIAMAAYSPPAGGAPPDTGKFFAFF